MSAERRRPITAERSGILLPTIHAAAVRHQAPAERGVPASRSGVSASEADRKVGPPAPSEYAPPGPGALGSRGTCPIRNGALPVGSARWTSRRSSRGVAQGKLKLRVRCC